MLARSSFIAIFLAIIWGTEVNAQYSANPPASEFHPDQTCGKCCPCSPVISELLEPQILADIKLLRDYIRSDGFRKLRDSCGDLRATDAIFLESLAVSEYNIERALFLSLMTVLEHKNVDLSIPLLGVVRLPLTFEGDSSFNLRINNLPSRLYRDTPDIPGGDRDKLQHFFGSAYLSYSLEERQWALMIGNFIEWGEKEFVAGGSDDWRDRRANRQGESFGEGLLNDGTFLPSDYLIFLFEADR
jgi:hypothetical protein